MASIESVRTQLGKGLAIPACPLALNAQRQFDERRQRALFRYYLAAGAGGLAVGVHTTQFAIRDPKVGLFKPVLELAAEEILKDAGDGGKDNETGEGFSLSPAEGERVGVRGKPCLVSESSPDPSPLPSPLPKGRGSPPCACMAIAGICGATQQAVAEATLARELGYHAGLLSLGALRAATEDELVAHCRAVAEIIPVFGFYLQPAAGGRVLPFSFWRRFAEIANVVAIKIAPFNRYQTLDVIRAVAEAGRDDIALYTGNDDNIVLDLLTPFHFRVGDEAPVALSPLQTSSLSDPTQGEGGGGGRGRNRLVERRIVGGLLGHWAVWTKRAVELHVECRRLAISGEPIPPGLLSRANEVTDCNAAFFDAANNYAGCIAGLHEILRRQGLLEGSWCLDPNETLSPGQREEIDRVCRAYPHLNDDEFVAQNRDHWLSG